MVELRHMSVCPSHTLHTAFSVPWCVPANPCDAEQKREGGDLLSRRKGEKSILIRAISDLRNKLGSLDCLVSLCTARPEHLKLFHKLKQYLNHPHILMKWFL